MKSKNILITTGECTRLNYIVMCMEEFFLVLDDLYKCYIKCVCVCGLYTFLVTIFDDR